MSLATSERLSRTEELFLITYDQNGLMRRDSWFHQPDDARRHFDYLQKLFPDAGVRLHVIPVEHAQPAPVFTEPAPGDNPWTFLEF